MFDTTSRYARQPTATHVDARGAARVYVSLREVPRPLPATASDQTVVVADNDRVDRLGARAYGAGELFWQLCDVNGALHPDDLIARAGRRIGLARRNPS